MFPCGEPISVPLLYSQDGWSSTLITHICLLSHCTYSMCTCCSIFQLTIIAKSMCKYPSVVW